MDVPASEIKVVLDPEYTAALRESVMATITNAVADARQKTYIDSDWVAGKNHIAKWLDISQSSLNGLIKQGFRFITSEMLMFGQQTSMKHRSGLLTIFKQNND